MKNILWWLLGLGAVVGGGAYIYSRTTGKKVETKDACIKDLPLEKFAPVNAAINAKDSNALFSFAVMADAQGWTCAAREMRQQATTLKAAALKAAEGAGAGGGGAAGGGAGGGTGALDLLPKPAKEVPFVFSGPTTPKEEPAPESPPKSDAELSIAELPEPLSTRVAFSLATLTHDADAWINKGASGLWKELKAAGYTAAAAEYRKNFVYDIYSDPSYVASPWATGG